MDTQETNVTNTTPAASEEPAPRPWVTPTFERVPLKEAMSGATPPFLGDIITYMS